MGGEKGEGIEVKERQHNLNTHNPPTNIKTRTLLARSGSRTTVSIVVNRISKRLDGYATLNILFSSAKTLLERTRFVCTINTHIYIYAHTIYNIYA